MLESADLTATQREQVSAAKSTKILKGTYETKMNCSQLDLDLSAIVVTIIGSTGNLCPLFGLIQPEQLYSVIGWGSKKWILMF